ncbi:hypothetical protein M758_6G211400 [Ceratodon purpureus]|nr:hypothetical protein M758_6G211400 [Ceratodon purpureus]
MAMAMCYSSSSCSGRMALQLVTLHRAFTCSSSSPLLLTRACRLRPGTKSALALAPSSKIIPLPRSYIHATVCPNSSRSFSSRATTPAAVRCSTMPLDVETRADVKGDESGMENNGWKIKMLYDGECPLCMREVNMLRERNKNYGDAIKFVDICADGYAAEENCNIDFETAMGRIHAIRKDGEVLTNIAAFRALYEEIGLGWVYAITLYQPWASILDTVYEFWAKYRLPITGRPALAKVLERRQQRKVKGGKSNADGTRCQFD